MHSTPRQMTLFFLGALFCLTPWASAGLALLLGVLLAVTVGNPASDLTKKLTHRFLSLAVVGLGAGMNLNTVARVGVQGIGYTVITIAATFLFGGLISRALRKAPAASTDTSVLVTIGTAICGGSAIAAAAPVLRAKAHEVSVSLGIVFLLNAVALFTFPYLGHAFSLTESQFGLWAALAIHDTSSVVGATLQYGTHALEVGTTVKLARALWIVPVTFVLGLVVGRRKTHEVSAPKAQPKKPWFILGFIIVAAIVTWVPALQNAGHVVEALAKHLLVLTLFLIGTNLTRETLRAVGFRPFLQGVLLWLIMASSTLIAVMQNWIHT